MAEERGDAETGNIPSTSIVGLETLIPRRKRRRSREETQASQIVRRRRTRSVIAAEATRAKWVDIEANIEFPILRPRTNNAPQDPVEEEPQLEGILYENGLLKEEV